MPREVIRFVLLFGNFGNAAIARIRVLLRKQRRPAKKNLEDKI